MNYIRLKSAIHLRQLTDRLRHHPEILELQLFEQDLYQPKRVANVIRMLKDKGITVYLHHPMRWRGEYVDILSEDPDRRDYYDWSCAELGELCQRERVRCVVHAHYAHTECTRLDPVRDSRRLRERIEQIHDRAPDWFLWENTTQGLFSQENPYLVSEVVRPLALPLCMDISHAFIAVKGDNKELQQSIAEAYPYIAYYHVVDSQGQGHDSLSLGEGKVDWGAVLPFLRDKDFIFEIGLENVEDCTPMVESARYLARLMSRSAASWA